MEYRDIVYSREGAVATITLNRPDKGNSFSPEMIHSIERAVTDASTDNGVRVLVLTGAGRAFCSGGDVAAMADQSAASRAEGTRDAVTEGAPLYGLVHHFPKPTVAAVNGVCVGGGLEIALACDIRIASDKARFSEAFARRGLMPMGGGTYVLPRLVGLDRACMLIWTGDMIDAKEAERIGLVSKVVPQEDLSTAVSELTAKLARAAPLAVRAAKQAVYRGLGTDLDAALDWAVERNRQLANTDDHREGSRAFVEKREPVFKGR
jgi:2-(1,2-epoxy-1,2-dihydrophenyl)acetyl-CoA isomerase